MMASIKIFIFVYFIIGVNKYVSDVFFMESDKYQRHSDTFISSTEYGLNQDLHPYSALPHLRQYTILPTPPPVHLWVPHCRI